MDTAPWQQELGLMKPMEDPVLSSNANTTRPQLMENRRSRPQKEQSLNCPRCNSTNTKFCYYNNYSLNQPRYFCKACRRYWTEGGSLRNVPVGGGSRKNKRSSSSSTSSSSSSIMINPSTAPNTASSSSQNTKLIHEAHDLNLTYPIHSLPEFTSQSTPMEFLRSGINGRGLMGPFYSIPDHEGYPSGFGIQEFRPPTLGFPLDGIGGGGGLQGAQETGGRLLFPFEDLKQVASASSTAAAAEFEQGRGQGGDPHGFWNGMIGGGSW